MVDTSTSPPTLVLNPALKFFRCRAVTSAEDVDRVVAAIINTMKDRVQSVPQGELPLDRLRGIEDEACPPADVTADCVAFRSARGNIETRIRIPARRARLWAEAVSQLLSDAAVFKAAQFP